MNVSWLTLAVLLAAAPALADEVAVARFDAYARTVGPLCATAASTRCFEIAFDLADADGSDGLSVGEVRALRADLGHWLVARGPALTTTETTFVALGMRIVDLVGIEQLHRSYDTNGDGELDRGELSADIALDERPLGRVVQDGAAVDWSALQARLGGLAGAMLPRQP
jgi:hypothetical protein